MKIRSLIPFFVLVLAMLSCNLPSAQPTLEAATRTVTVTPTNQFFPPTSTFTLTPPAAITSVPTLTGTPTVPVVTPLDKGVNCRYGPGTEWLVIGALLVGQNANIQGKNGDASWWYVSTPNEPGKPCWVAASVTTAAGNLSSIPVVPKPQASVIDTGVSVTPDTMSVAGCIGPLAPVSIKGGIETNGPATVKWYFETQQSGAMSSQTTEFTTADTKEVSVDYTPVLTAGTYWVRLIITSPNNDSAEARYKIECP